MQYKAVYKQTIKLSRMTTKVTSLVCILLYISLKVTM